MRVALFAVTSAMVAAACSGTSGDKPAGDKPSTDKPAPAGAAGSGGTGADPWGGSADVPPPPAPNKLVVDDPGAAPRRVLAYTLAPYERTIELRTDIAVQSIAWSCAARGKCHYAVRSFLVGKDDEFQKLAKEITGDATISASGEALIQPATLMHLTPSPPELIGLAIAPLPGVAVGAGATWHVGKRTYRLAKLAPLEITFAQADVGEQIDATLAIDLAQPVARAMMMRDRVTVGGAGQVPIVVTLR